MTKQIIAVHGATGAQGRPVVHALLLAGYAVQAISRSGSTDGFEGSVTGFSADLLNVTQLASTYAGVAAVIIVLPGGATDDTAQRHSETILKALKRAQVPRAIFNSSGGLWDAPTGVPMIDARSLLAQNLSTTVRHSTVIAPAGIFFDVFSEGWVMERLMRDNVLVGPAPAEASMRPVAMADLAAVMVDLLRGAQSWPPHIVVSGPEDVTGTAFATAIAAQRGKPTDYLQISPAEHMQAVADGLSQQYAKNIGALYGPGANVPPPSAPGGGARFVTGPTGLATFVVSQSWD
ncbi:MAG: NAD(P)H-binding protein [Pseudomonadota bacterium]